jgi:putative membrane-bound dehydrogenase-like protein
MFKICLLLTFGMALKADVKLEFHHPNIESVNLFAESPDIVTPVGIAVAPDGRVFVQENHTHKRQKSYKGPATDRILVFEDSDGDGKWDKRSVFYEGHVHSTDLLFGPDGHLYVSTRWYIGRFKHAATRSSAQEAPEVIVRCETEGDYPHNGVGGLAIDPARPDWLAFGFGENLGADYTFVGSDGIRLSGGGEGGSTYLCKTDGSQLSRQSTGIWNAFGMTYDLHGNLFQTDNDPSSTPPNRLLHVIPGSDFGYEYRYGRSGRHPLISWYGEIPGTLAMAGALGEAACGITPYGPNKLLSASWTDNRIDLHFLKPNGASFKATRKKFISGPDDFRPVHFSISADRKHLYVSDWVSLSYPVHGQGRIWRVTFKEPLNLNPLPRKEKISFSAQTAFEHLGSEDPYMRIMAIQTLIENPAALKEYDWKAEENAIRVAHYAVALKRQSAKENAVMIPKLLQHDHAMVRFVAIKWISDEKLYAYRGQLENLLQRKDLNKRTLKAIAAALDHLEGRNLGEFSANSKMLAFAMDGSKPKAIRALALQSVAADYSGLSQDKLETLMQSNHLSIIQEVVRIVVLRKSHQESELLLKVAGDIKLPGGIRADAIAGLSEFNEVAIPLLKQLQNDTDPVVAHEARRSLGIMGIGQRNLDTASMTGDVQDLENLLRKTPGEPNTQNGRRLFFHPKVAMCASCHAMDGRGREVGPDLTTIHQQGDPKSMRKWLLEHIMNPNAEVAPYFRPQTITTKDGQSFMGLIVGREGSKQGYITPTGQKIFVAKKDIIQRQEIEMSIMPPGLLYTMTLAEIRDLLAYLLKGEE